jgi:hypothetical protein
MEFGRLTITFVGVEKGLDIFSGGRQMMGSDPRVAAHLENGV